MQQKGQLSFDVYFAIIFAIITAQQMIMTAGQFGSSSSQLGILSQEKNIAENLSRLLSGSMVLSQYPSAEISFIIPLIFDSSKQSFQPCQIEIQGNTGTITVYYPNEASSTATSEAKAFFKQISIETPTGTQVWPLFSFKCGEKITIKK
jgi:hypothetical protein